MAISNETFGLGDYDGRPVRTALEEVLDALEGMVEQHFIAYPDGVFGHAFTSANEEAADVLAKHRPRLWRLHRVGLERGPW